MLKEIINSLFSCTTSNTNTCVHCRPYLDGFTRPRSVKSRSVLIPGSSPLVDQADVGSPAHRTTRSRYASRTSGKTVTFGTWFTSSKCRPPSEVTM